MPSEKIDTRPMTVQALINTLTVLKQTGKIRPDAEVHLAGDEEGNNFGRMIRDISITVSVENAGKLVTLWPAETIYPD